MLIGNTSQGLPIFHDGNASRVLGRIKTDKPKVQIKAFAEYLANSNVPSIDLTTIGNYDRYQKNIPILDQGQVGSCVAHGHATAMMKARDLQGMTYQALSPDGLYAFIDNGTDQGSDPADAITALEKTGIPLLSDISDNFILLSNINAAALANALRFRIVPGAVYQCQNFQELVTADYLGFATTLTINVGNNFNPSSNGLVGYSPGVANHCVSGGEALKQINGQWAYRFRNSWNTTWGENGCAWFTAEFTDQQPQVELYAIQWVLSDPQDPTNIPTLN
jgi:hypothetical protein